MADVLIRDIPEDVLAGVDAHAARLGMSRVEYVRRRLAADAATQAVSVSTKDLRRFADKFADLADESIMDAAWRVAAWLIDKSALVRLADSPDAARWAQRIERGLVRITTVTLLEVGYSARTAAQARSAKVEQKRYAHPPWWHLALPLAVVAAMVALIDVRRGPARGGSHS